MLSFCYLEEDFHFFLGNDIVEDRFTEGLVEVLFDEKVNISLPSAVSSTSTYPPTQVFCLTVLELTYS